MNYIILYMQIQFGDIIISMDKEKTLLRKKMKTAMTEFEKSYVIDSNFKIVDNIIESDLYKNAHTVFTFIPMDHEIDIRPIITDALNRGKTVSGPKCFKDRHMQARKIKSFDDVVPGPMKIPEPKDSCPIISKEKIDLVLVPCLAANKEGYRLGYGAGYYDRYLKDYIGSTILLCREEQLIKHLPVESHDIKTDYYVTEKGLFPTAP